MLKRIVSILFIVLSIFFFFYNIKDIDTYEKIVCKEIKNNNILNKYFGYVTFVSQNYKLLIDTREDTLDNNMVLMMNTKEVFNNNYGNVILAGHNNKYVFNVLYKLKVGDVIKVSDFNKEYSYMVDKIEFINIKNKKVLDEIYDKKILTLITCTNNNQVRYVVRANHIISHN